MIIDEVCKSSDLTYYHKIHVSSKQASVNMCFSFVEFVILVGRSLSKQVLNCFKDLLSLKGEKTWMSKTHGAVCRGGCWYQSVWCGTGMACQRGIGREIIPSMEVVGVVVDHVA